MAFWVARTYRPFIALALGSIGLVACSSATPTAPSSLAASDAGPHAETASVSSPTVTAGAAQANAATTIKITQGTLALQSLVSSSLTLRGSHGFRFDGSISSGLEPSTTCGVFDPCPPGTSVPFKPIWVGTDFSGTARVQGDEFAVGSADGPSLYLELTGSFVAPAHVTDTATVTVPFTASGLFSRLYPLPVLQLSGRGEVTFTLQWQPAFNGWSIRFSSFDFGGGRPA